MEGGWLKVIFLEGRAERHSHRMGRRWTDIKFSAAEAEKLDWKGPKQRKWQRMMAADELRGLPMEKAALSE